METNESWIRRTGAAWLQFGAVLAAIGIASFAAVSSWTHGVGVAQSVGEPNAPIVPATVDGMMIAGTLLATRDRIRGRRPGGWTNFCLWAGGMMTLGFNVMSALDRTYPNAFALGKGIFVASMSAVALIATVEAIFHPGKRLLEVAESTATKLVNNVKNVESAPDAQPVAKPVAQPVPAKKTTPPPQGMRGRRPGPQVKPGNRPNMQPQSKQGQGTQPKQTRPAVIEAVVVEEKPEPVARETAEISAH